MNQITSSVMAAKNRPITRPITFSFLHYPVRAFAIKNEPWFVGKDVCDALEITNARQAVGRLEDYEKLTYTLYTSGQNREVWLVNESGMYSLTLTSRTREAKKFKKWLTTEVLPQIRKTGSYGKTDKRLEMMETQISNVLIPVIIENQELREENRRLKNRCVCTPDDKREILDLSKAGFNVTQIKEKTKKGKARIKRVIGEAAADAQPGLWDQAGNAASRDKGGAA
jgi:prophage antirepressor-like protein